MKTTKSQNYIDFLSFLCILYHTLNKHRIKMIKVKSVQLGKTLGLSKVPLTETEEGTQVRKEKIGSKHFGPQS